jgi:putative glutathione S-transferase
MYTTLVRFDEVYHTHFMCNHKLIREYDSLWPYLRDLYQTPGFGETTHMSHIKEHYYTTHPDVSPKRIVPLGPDPEFNEPHDRDELTGEPPV